MIRKIGLILVILMITAVTAMSGCTNKDNNATEQIKPTITNDTTPEFTNKASIKAIDVSCPTCHQRDELQFVAVANYGSSYMGFCKRDGTVFSLTEGFN